MCWKSVCVCQSRIRRIVGRRYNNGRQKCKPSHACTSRHICACCLTWCHVIVHAIRAFIFNFLDFGETCKSNVLFCTFNRLRRSFMIFFLLSPGPYLPWTCWIHKRKPTFHDGQSNIRIKMMIALYFLCFVQSSSSAIPNGCVCARACVLLFSSFCLLSSEHFAAVSFRRIIVLIVANHFQSSSSVPFKKGVERNVQCNSVYMDHKSLCHVHNMVR